MSWYLNPINDHSVGDAFAPFADIASDVYYGAMSCEIPTFHDGNLTGVSLAVQAVRLSLTRENGELWEVALTGVTSLHMDDFREGNIIGAFEIVRGLRPDRELLERLFRGPHSAAPSKYHQDHARLLDAKADQVEAGEAAIVSITPSYGADFVAYAKGVEVKPTGQTAFI